MYFFEYYYNGKIKDVDVVAAGAVARKLRSDARRRENSKTI